MKKTVIFDMDGVIFDTESVMKRFWQEEADRYNFGDITELYMKCVGVTEQYCEEMMARDYPELPPFAEFKARPFAAFRQYNEEHGMPMKPHVTELLTALKQNGFTIGLASSTYLETVRRELSQAGLLSFFDVVIGGDLLSRSKPEPDIYLMACEKAGTAPEDAYAIEDSYNGVRSASSAGMHTIMVPDMLPPTEEMERLSEAILPDLAAVQAYLLETR
jgi:HAD superfamily hydrolase (TIGR01509 family)